MREVTFAQAIAEAVDEEMKRDPSVFLIGQSVGPAGGSAGQLKGIFHKYGPERVRQTPISETAIVGACIGAALTGMRPVADFQYADFLYIPMDEIVNNLSKMVYVFGGKVKMPVTIMSIFGAGLSRGYQHSKSIEGMLICVPGLKVVIPSTPYDCKGLLKSAIRDDNPVVFLVPRLFIVSSRKSIIPDEDYIVPLGKAEIKREGRDVTVVATGFMVQQALASAAKLQEKGISIEVIDPRTLVPLDKQAILDSVKKTRRLVIITEECKTGSAAGEISAIVADEAFEHLDAPIKRVNAPDVPIPFSPPLEKFYMPDEEDLNKAVTKLM